MEIISLGLGVQSTALYYMSSLGELPRVDYAIFADTGREKTATMQYLKFLQTWSKKNNGIPLIIINRKNLFHDLLSCTNSTNNRFVSIPAFTKSNGKAGMLRRQCTSEYKIEQIDSEIRKLYGYAPYKRLPETYIYIGISSDEIERAAIPRQRWKVIVYPFLGHTISHNSACNKFPFPPMNRSNIIAWYKDKKLPIPVKSSCVFCPYQPDASWLELKNNHSKDFKDAIKIDRIIRNGLKKKIHDPIYLHKSLKPLEFVEFDENQTTIWGECSGTCHI